MGKNVLIISTSLRSGSNSEILAKECARGAEDAGHTVDFVSLKGKEIKFCNGCLSCLNTRRCVHRDDVPEIMEKVRNSDSIVFATPIYYYGMSGQMKTLLDRLNPLYAVDCAFRDVYLLATAQECGDAIFERAYTGLSGWVECFRHARLSGWVTGGGIDDPGDAPNHPDVMQQAYELGKNL